VPGDLGVPSREKLDALAATLGIFNWLEANGIGGPELERVKTAFMFEHGVWAQRWLDQADPPPSWEQMADLLRENERLKAEATHRQVPKIANRPFNGPGHDPEEIDDIVVAPVTMFRFEFMDKNVAWMCCYFDDGPDHERITWHVRGRDLKVTVGELPSEWEDLDSGEFHGIDKTRQREIAKWRVESAKRELEQAEKQLKEIG
jgi:hypothetical protein